MRTGAGAPHLRVVAAELERSCQGHSEGSAPAWTYTHPRAAALQTLEVEKVRGTGLWCTLDQGPIRRSLASQVFWVGLQRAGCTAWPGRRGLGLVRRWACSPGNGAGYGAPQRPKRVASRRAGPPPPQLRAGLTGDHPAPQPAHSLFLSSISLQKPSFAYPSLKLVFLKS